MHIEAAVLPYDSVRSPSRVEVLHNFYYYFIFNYYVEGSEPEPFIELL